MTLSKKPYKGTRDFFPEAKRIQDYLFSSMHKSASLYGFEHYNGPMLEEVELYKAKSGEELITEQIYSFNDRGDRFVAIRPEMTPTLARMVANIHREAPKPIRWYSIPNLMRYERPQKGRLREHWQFNCDIFGAPGRTGEVEILQVAITLMESFGANSEMFEILINDRDIVDSVFNKLMKVDKETSYKLYKIIDKSKKINQEALDKMLGELSLEKAPLDIFEKYLKIDSVKGLSDFLKSHNQTEANENFQEFYSLAVEAGIEDYLTFDPSIVRGLDYYTGVVFEIFDKHPDNRRALCGGGAYGNLLQIFNEPALPGVGFGLGDVTLTDFLMTHELLPDLSKPNLDLFLSIQSDSARTMASNLSQGLRKLNVKTLFHAEAIKFKKAFPLGEKRGAKYVILLGEDEVTNNKIQIKNLESKEQAEFSVDDTTEIAKYILG